MPDWTFVIGLVSGAIIGCISSCYLWNVQINHRRGNIASALKNDILKLNERIQKVAYPHEIKKAHSSGRDNTLFILPFYEKTDLFYTVMTDIFDFNTPLSEKIFEFYRNVINAENYRQMLIKEQDFRFDDEMYACLPPIVILTHEIIPMLEREIKWNILIPHSLSKYFK